MIRLRMANYERRVNMTITKFEDLNIWKLSIKATKEIYDLTATGDLGKDFGLKDQLRRAVVSISSNIVEGFEKNNNNELVRYLRIAKGSMGEVRNQLYVALSVGYIPQERFVILNIELEDLARQIGGFIVYLINKKKQNKITR